METVYEIFPLNLNTSPAEWQQFLDTLPFHHKTLDTYRLEITFERHLVHYFLFSPRTLPTSLVDTEEKFLLKQTLTPAAKNNPDQNPIQNTPETSTPPSKKSSSKPALFLSNFKALDSATKLNAFLKLHYNSTLKSITFSFKKLSKNHQILLRSHLTDSRNHQKLLLFATPAQLLSTNFTSSKEFLHSTPPVFLDLSKSLLLFAKNSANSLVKIDTFPYSSEDYYLGPLTFDFKKHTIVFGASGSGKSKFLSLLVKNLLKTSKAKIIVLDPHANLENDIGGLGEVIDFTETPLNLFNTTNPNQDNITSATELLLDTFQSLLNTKNAKLERVLHHSIFLLISLNNFDFQTLRKLLLDSTFRNNLITKNQSTLPTTLTTFFLAEFTEIKTQSFNEAIAPIITFIDELETLPALRHPKTSKSLTTFIEENQLLIFSLDRTKLGNRTVKTLSSLLMCQLFNLIQNHETDEHLIFIIDEVAIIENPILQRFLSEARKFNLTLILAGQYFSALSHELQEAIFANTANYCIFRISKNDATLLIEHIDFKLPLKDTETEKIKLLTNLQDRECLLRLSAGGKLIPAFKCITLDFESHPRRHKPSIINAQFQNLKPIRLNAMDTSKPFSFAKHQPNSQHQPKSKFNPTTSVNLHDILTLTSTARKSARELQSQK